jgi:hypothetical protein
MRNQQSITRRGFLGTTARRGTALSAMAVAAPTALGARAPSETIGVGRIGVGVRGGTLVEQVAGTGKLRCGKSPSSQQRLEPRWNRLM